MIKFFILNLIIIATFAVSTQAEITSEQFKHHFIARDTPVEGNPGFGTSAMADFDQDGDLDFAAATRRDVMFWYEYQSADEWVQHELGLVGVVQLGGTVFDVDQDGWTDIISGGIWYRNPQNPRESKFEHYYYDDRIKTEIHDIAMADINGDDKEDVVALGDKEGTFWYEIPEETNQDINWERHLITDAVLDWKVDIHSGFSTNGIADLDNDGDLDIVLPDRWLENEDQGQKWSSHYFAFGTRSPYGVSGKSWVEDMDNDGDLDIVIADSDQLACQIAIMFSNGEDNPRFSPYYLEQPVDGVRGSFHSLQLADFDLDGDLDIFTAEQEASPIRPIHATPRWFIFENLNENGREFKQRVILDAKLGCHDAWVGDVDNDGDPDICAKIWSRWGGNGNGGEEHVNYLENLIK